MLLDTHALLWWLADDPRLSPAANEGIADPRTLVHVSVASVWEAAIKIAANRLGFSGDLRQQIASNGFVELTITSQHAIAAAALPRHHGDPFDRILVAQAQLEGLRLVTRDRRISQYGVVTLW